MKFPYILMVLFGTVLCALGQANQSVHVDEFGNVTCEEYLARMDGIIVQAAQNSDSRFFVFVYEGKVRTLKRDKEGNYISQLVNPQYGLARANIAKIKYYLKTRSARISQFEIVSAGFREEAMVDVWRVSDGAAPPLSSPTLKKMKYRKGKPSGFCIGCCG